MLLFVGFYNIIIVCIYVILLDARIYMGFKEVVQCVITRIWKDLKIRWHF